MVSCIECGAELEENATHCPECGAEISDRVAEGLSTGKVWAIILAVGIIIVVFIMVLLSFLN
jgi:uncharacterized paraquat-inducible protein A